MTNDEWFLMFTVVERVC